MAEGIVTSVNDDGQEGRIKLKLPWFNEEFESEWSRVSQFYAGNGYGAFFVPEVGDEVLVAFVHGDLRFPVIIGGLYNGKDKPPSFRADNKDQKMIRTRGQHEILMDDTNGEQRVRIKTKDGNEADLNDKDKKITVNIPTGQSIEIDGQGNKITIKTAAGQSISLDGNSNTITLTGPMTINLEATSIALGGSAATQHLILGELFMALFNAHVHTPGIPTTTPPVTPMTPAMLSQVSKTV
ncbi:MAG TPA: phage baseplate assembly protein V [Pyrinomonadaceae bacterium]|nr:phage baseplate assembly protein V [Pyrinomonadaceae bacterium]